MNTGKHVKASNLQSMFRAAYISLHADVGSSHTLKTMFDSHLIMLSWVFDRLTATDDLIINKDYNFVSVIMSQSFLVALSIRIAVFVITVCRVAVVHSLTILSSWNGFVSVLRCLIVLLVCVDYVARIGGVSHTFSSWNRLISSGVLRSSVGNVISANGSIGRIYFLLWWLDNTGSSICFSSSNVLLSYIRTRNVLLLSSLNICSSLLSLITSSFYLKRLFRIMNDLSE
jgi:hypothetical protein